MDNKYDYNKICTVKELCQMLGFKYDKYHSKRSLEEIERHFELEKISDRKYRLVKELSKDEKIERLQKEIEVLERLKEMFNGGQ